MDTAFIILAALLALSEALALIPSVAKSSWFRRSNGILDGLRKLLPGKSKE